MTPDNSYVFFLGKSLEIMAAACDCGKLAIFYPDDARRAAERIRQAADRANAEAGVIPMGDIARAFAALLDERASRSETAP